MILEIIQILNDILALLDLFTAAVVSLPLALIWAIKFGKNINIKKYILLGLFVLYLNEMYLIVGVPGIQYISWHPIVSLIPFNDLNADGFSFQIIMNAIMFMPLGFMLPIIWDGFKSFPRTFICGVLTSAFIEVIQLFSIRATDVDDLIMNSLGCAIGFIAIWAFKKKKWKSMKKKINAEIKSDSIELMILNAIVILVIVFIRYSIAEFIYTSPLFA